MVELTVDSGIAWITLNRPEVLNAMDLKSVRAFATHLESIRDRKDVRVVVTRGAGRAFCAGSDLKELASMSASEAASAEKEHGEAFALLDSIGQPTIARLHGYVLGGGLGLALYHDFRIAAKSASFGLPEVELGWTPPWGVGRLMDVAGGAEARWLAMACERVTAEEAEGMGLVNAVVEDDRVEERVRALADRLAGFPRAGLRETKALINRMSPLRSADWDELASKAFETCYETPEAREKVSRFVAGGKG